MFLRGIEGDIITSEILDLLQAGLVHCVLLEVANLLPYQCSSCSNTVTNLRLEKPSVTCQGCGVGACSMCFSTAELGWTYMCPPCGFTLDNARLIPVRLMNLKGRKKSSATPPINSRENASTERVEEVTIEDAEDTEETEETQDETTFFPLGQGSPPLQSTQAGDSANSVRVFPDFSLDLTRSQVTQERATLQTAVVSGAGSAEAAVDTSEGFIEPPKRVKAGLRKQKQATKTQNETCTTPEDSEVPACRFFMKGNCKFGFFGKGKSGQGKCPFKHPKTCKKLMDNGSGQGGCSKGKSCDTVHPKMCNQSMLTRSCPNIKDGARCSAGYHVRGTKFAVTKPPGANITTSKNSKTEELGQRGPRGKQRKDNVSNSVSASPSYLPVSSAKPLSNGTSEGDQQAALNSVFSEIIRAEVIKLLQTGTLWPQPISQSCGPAVPVAVPRGQGPTTTMGNLGALLSLLGAQHPQ
jgi:predicted RNA-binding Zn-ribbon protein involved in translation (DUF1610 family)